MPAAPLTFEQTPPPAEEIPPALAALTDAQEPEQIVVTTNQTMPTDPALMDLGTDAQAQGHVLGLRTIASRLVGAARDLRTLEMHNQARDLEPIVEDIATEIARLMTNLEQRGRQRRGE